MTITGKGAGETAARFRLSGFVSTGASWIETYNFQVDGAAITDADDFEWQFNFRSAYGDQPSLALTTTDGTLTITQSSETTALGINVLPDSLTALDGDYIADLAYETVGGDRVHWGHGIVTFRNEPIWND